MSKEKKSKNKDYSRYYPLFFTLVFVVVLFQYSFSSLESIFYDHRVKYDWGIGFDDNIVIVMLDEESDEYLGEKYPYTYASHERFLNRLLQDQPSIISYVVDFKEPISSYESRDLFKFKKSINRFKDRGGGFRLGTKVNFWGEQLPPANLQDLGYSTALLNVDGHVFAGDNICRRAILNISGNSSFHLWIANEYRMISDKKPLDEKSISGSYYVKEADATFALFRYYTSPVETKRKISRIPFHKVLVGNFPKGFFNNKVVLIGPSYLSNSSDYILTPFNSEKFESSKLTVHAQVIQALIQNKTVYQVSKTISYVLSLVIALILSLAISRIRPTRGLLITIIVMLCIFIVSSILFSIFGYWLYTVHLILTVFIVYYVLVPFRAIVEYQRRFAIQEESKLLRKVENLKQNFISLMSHDLKTPVAKIAGMADVMLHQHKNADSAIIMGLRGIIDATKELNRFITSILDLTKVESRNLNLFIVSKDINPLIENAIEDLRFEASSKNIELKVNLSPLYPIKVDLNLMKRVMANLVENAIKYSGDGKVVTVKTWDDQEWVYIEVRDNGVGIGKNDLQHIFDKFYRVKNDASHSIKGSGLGLFLVKYFVELQGGKIIVDSVMGEGTAFKVKLKNV